MTDRPEAAGSRRSIRPAAPHPGRRSVRTLAALAAVLAVALAAGGCQRFGNDDLALYRKAKTLWEKGQHNDAARTFVTLTEIYPESPLVEDALFWAANLYQHFLERPGQAERYYRQLLVGFPEGRFRLDAMENLARVYAERQGDRYKAVLTYKNLRGVEALSGKQDYYQFRIGEVYLDMGRLEQARYAFHRLITEHPESPLVPRAYYLIGFSYYQEGRKPRAVVAFNQVHKDFPNSELASRARFFMADIYEEQGLMQKALQVYESLKGKYHDPDILGQRISALKGRMNRSVQ